MDQTFRVRQRILINLSDLTKVQGTNHKSLYQSIKAKPIPVPYIRGGLTTFFGYIGSNFHSFGNRNSKPKSSGLFADFRCCFFQQFLYIAHCKYRAWLNREREIKSFWMVATKQSYDVQKFLSFLNL